MQGRLDPMKCLGEAWDFFKDRPGLAIAGLIAYGAIAIIGQFIPLLGFLFGMLVLPVIMGGLFIFSLHLAGTGEPRLEDLFAGFEKYGRIMGVYWLYSAAAMLMLLPGLAIMFVSMLANPNQEPSAIAFLVFAINMLVMFVLFLRFSMVFFIMVDEPHIGVFDCFKRSSQLTEGNRGNVFALMFLLGLVSIVGMLAFFVGLLVAMPVTVIAWARAYLWLKSFHPPFRQLGFPDPEPQPTQPREPVAP